MEFGSYDLVYQYDKNTDESGIEQFDNWEASRYSCTLLPEQVVSIECDNMVSGIIPHVCPWTVTVVDFEEETHVLHYEHLPLGLLILWEDGTPSSIQKHFGAI